MIIINKSGFIRYKNLKFKCTLGRAGVGEKKVEGDNITPIGVYRILNVYYRKDRIKNLNTRIKINPNMDGWKDPFFNFFSVIK
jgi:L,D-peptidoglycan transpeptidase YkuD (ErfK/YbiS/YcfS/YnhG family)